MDDSTFGKINKFILGENRVKVNKGKKGLPPK